MLRYTLSGVEKDNSGISEIFRCHKSYIINKNKISSITGNAAGYKLILLGYNTPIPVSRKWNKDIASITI
jgi:DNA-binding LytR/AlgR family response regulator